MSETLKGSASEWLERPEDGLSPEQRKEKGQMEMLAANILKEVEQQEMNQTFDALGRPENITVEQVREKTDFQEAPRVNEALKEIAAGAEQYARENEASFIEGLEHQLGEYESRIEETADSVVKEEMVSRAAWNSVLIDEMNNLQAEQAAREAGPNDLPGDIL